MKKKSLKMLFMLLFFMCIPLFINASGYDAEINGNDVRIRSGAGTNHNVIVSVNRGTEITVLEDTLYSGTGCDQKWAKVLYKERHGYVCSRYVKKVDKSNSDVTVIDWSARIYGNDVSVRQSPGGKYIEGLSIGVNVTILGTYGDWYKVQYYGNKIGYVSKKYVIKKSDITASDDNYSKELSNAGFPDTYIPYLTYLHKKYPNWKFIADKTNLDFNTSVNKETGKNYMQTTNDSYRTSSTPAEGKSWYYVNSEVVAFYLDPRNWLNEKYMFMFEKLDYDKSLESSYPSLTKAIFGNGKLKDDKYTVPMFNAGKSLGISPVHIASRIRQEVSSNGSASTDGRSFTYRGQTRSGYYNFFNIGAHKDDYTNDPVTRGLAYAAKLIDRSGNEWNNIEVAIKEGASFLAVSYITKGQNTLYFQKFNVSSDTKFSKYTHQYQTNIQAPATEGTSAYNAYVNGVNIGQTFIFRIPVYNNMPNYTSLPKSGDNNNHLSKLEVVNYNITPSFDKDVLTYDSYVPKTTNKVTIKANAQSSNATITGTGEYELKDDETDITISVVSQTGIKRQYTITINKVDDTTTTKDVINSSYVNDKNGFLTNIRNNTLISDLKNNLIKNGAKNIIVTDSNGKVQRDNSKLTSGQKITIITNMETKTYTAVVRGDVSGDGNITIHDLLLVQRYLVGDEGLYGAAYYAADVSNDNKVTIYDLLLVQKHLVGDERL